MKQTEMGGGWDTWTEERIGGYENIVGEGWVGATVEWWRRCHVEGCDWGMIKRADDSGSGYDVRGLLRNWGCCTVTVSIFVAFQCCLYLIYCSSFMYVTMYVSLHFHYSVQCHLTI